MAKKSNDSLITPTMEASISDAAARLNKDNKGAFSIRADAASFRKSTIFTPFPNVNLMLRPVLGAKYQILGTPQSGKTLLTYAVMGAVQRTCRHCQTPILTFLNDWTGEEEKTCFCGKQVPMRILFADAEMSFDPAWFATWGGTLGTGQFGSPDMSDFTEISEGVSLSPDSSFCVARVTSAEQLSIIAQEILQSSAIDFLAIDSLAQLMPLTRKEGKDMMGDEAKAITRLYKVIINAQAESFSKGHGMPTIWSINQERVKIGGFSPIPGVDATKPVGGMALQFNATQTWKLRTRYNQQDGMKQAAHVFGDTIITSSKDKESGGANATADYRVYTGEHTKGGISYAPGDTNEGANLFKYVLEMGELDSRWFQKKSASKYIVLGRELNTKAAINEFLTRPDISYQVQFLLAAQRFPLGLRCHINPEKYMYNPFTDDPIMELMNEAIDKFGEAALPKGKVFKPHVGEGITFSG